MKRQSIAEQTLTKQIILLDTKINNLQAQINSIQNSKDATIAIRDQLRSEKDALYRARINASQKAKP